MATKSISFLYKTPTYTSYPRLSNSIATIFSRTLPVSRFLVPSLAYLKVWSLSRVYRGQIFFSLNIISAETIKCKCITKIFDILANCFMVDFILIIRQCLSNISGRCLIGYVIHHVINDSIHQNRIMNMSSHKLPDCLMSGRYISLYLKHVAFIFKRLRYNNKIGIFSNFL